MLSKAAVLCGEVADHALLDEEALGKQDAFISLTGFDEDNILSSLYAVSQNVPKVVTKVNNENLITLIKDTGLRSIIIPKNIVAGQILCYVRALVSRKPGGDVLSLYKLVDDHAEFLKFAANSDAGVLLGIPLAKLAIKKDTLIACLVRKGRVVIPGGADCIEEGDRVLVTTSHQRLNKFTDILEGTPA